MENGMLGCVDWYVPTFRNSVLLPQSSSRNAWLFINIDGKDLKYRTVQMLLWWKAWSNGHSVYSYAMGEDLRLSMCMSGTLDRKYVICKRIHRRWLCAQIGCYGVRECNFILWSTGM